MSFKVWKIDIGGTTFTTSEETVKKIPYFLQYITKDLKQLTTGFVSTELRTAFIDRNPNYFQLILDLARNCKENETVTKQMVDNKLDEVKIPRLLAPEYYYYLNLEEPVVSPKKESAHNSFEIMKNSKYIKTCMSLHSKIPVPNSHIVPMKIKRGELGPCYLNAYFDKPVMASPKFYIIAPPNLVAKIHLCFKISPNTHFVINAIEERWVKDDKEKINIQFWDTDLNTFDRWFYAGFVHLDIYINSDKAKGLDPDLNEIKAYSLACLDSNLLTTSGYVIGETANIWKFVDFKTATIILGKQRFLKEICFSADLAMGNGELEFIDKNGQPSKSFCYQKLKFQDIPWSILNKQKFDCRFQISTAGFWLEDELRVKITVPTQLKSCMVTVIYYTHIAWENDTYSINKW